MDLPGGICFVKSIFMITVRPSVVRHLLFSGYGGITDIIFMYT